MDLFDSCSQGRSQNIFTGTGGQAGAKNGHVNC